MLSKPKKRSKKLPFSVIDFVVYPTHGVGSVVDVVTEEVAGFELRLYVINFAAQSHVCTSFTNPLETYATNIIGSSNILESSRRSKIPNFVCCLREEYI